MKKVYALFLFFCLANLKIAAQQAGTLDDFLNLGGDNNGVNGFINDVRVYPDGRILITGLFTGYRGIAQANITRLNPDGSLDPTFISGNGSNGEIQDAQLLPNGKILIAGFFTQYNGIIQNRVARLNADGSLDNSFNLGGNGANGSIYTIQATSEGKILIAGAFTQYNGTNLNRIARLNSDGSIDNTFQIGNGISVSGSLVLDLELQPDNKILVGGQFSLYNGTFCQNIIRLNTDGSLDNTFNSGATINGAIYCVRVLDNAKIMVGGSFTVFNNPANKNIARLFTNGSLDVSFNPGQEVNGYLETIQSQPDGKFLIGGGFTSYNNTPRYFMARLKENGNLDETFNPTNREGNSTIKSFQIRPDGRVWIGGNFTKFNNQNRNGIARIYCSVPTIPTNLTNTEVNFNSFRLHWNKISGITNYEVDVSNNNFLSLLPNYASLLVKDSTLLIENLAPGVSYACRARAINEQSASPNSKALVVTIKPQAPQNLKAKPLSINQIELNWEAEPTDGSSYKIQYAQDSAFLFTDLVLITNNTYTHPGLKPQTNYFYRIQTFKNGVFSEFSEIVGARTLSDEVITSLNDKKISFTIYPNPVSKQVKINWENLAMEIHTLRILNVWGKEIAFFPTQDLPDKSLEINLENWANGIYFIQLLNKEKIITRKLIK